MDDEQHNAPTTWATLSLSPDHLARLQDSGITPEVAAERGYRTVNSSDEVPDIFNPMQRRLVPALLIPVYGVDETAEPVTYEIRPDKPRSDGRTARNGAPPKERKYEFPSGQAKVLDVPKRCQADLGNPEIPLWITEGARKADAAAAIGMTAVSIAGVWAFRSTNVDGGKVELPDFDRVAFNGRTVYIAFDSDVVTKAPVRKAMVRLAGVLTRRGSTVKVVVLPSGPLGEKRGLDDMIASGARQDNLVALVDEQFLEEDDRGIAEKLRDFILDSYELGQDLSGNGFAVPRRGTRLVRMLYTGRPSLELEAPRLFSKWEAGDPVVQRKTVKDVMPTIEMACMDTPRQPLHLRAAPYNGDIVVDMGDPKGRIIHITADGWEVVEKPNSECPLFRRTENVTELPTPVAGGTLEELRGLLNVTDHTWALIKGWLVASLFGWVPRPWLYHSGPQGSGKSDAALIALSVIDPRETLDTAPKKNDRSDPAALAYNSYCLGYDNLTNITPEFSDWLCSVVTGARDSRRILMTTASMSSMAFMRTGAMTGVAIRAIRPDLLERLVKVEFERLPTGGKKRHSAIMDAFKEAHPRILGALLDAVVGVLRHQKDVPADLDVPRMVDYATILKAHDIATGDTTFDAYRETVLAQLDESGQDDAVGKVVVDYVAQHGAIKDEPAGVYQVLTKHQQSMGLDDEDFWPKNARYLSTALQELVAALERVVTIKMGKSNGVRWVSLAPVERRDARDATDSAASLPASLSSSQVNPGFNPDRDARDAIFQTSHKSKEANSEAGETEFAFASPRGPESSVPCDPCVPEPTSDPEFSQVSDLRDAGTQGGLFPNANSTASTKKAKPARVMPTAPSRRVVRPVDSDLPTLAPNTATTTRSPLASVAPDAVAAPRCPSCPGTKELIPPTYFMYACPACYPATFETGN